MFDVQRARNSFPILDQEVFGHQLVYLDNAATLQMPEAVLQVIVQHYHADNANVHRGIHALSERSTRALETARERVRVFLKADSSDEIVFTSGTTGSLNMLADMWFGSGRGGGAVITTMMEHHANFVPWQQACAKHGCEFLVAPLDERGNLDLAALEVLLSRPDVSLLAVAHVSNVLGTVNPIERIVDMAHAHDVAVVVDAAQSIRHEPVDVKALDCDFLAFSGHKMGAPTGIGVLYGKMAELERLRPVRFGGEMVDGVRVAEATFERPPLRFEAGTPNYVGAIGLAAAMDYVDSLGRADVSAYEHELLAYAEERLAGIDGLSLLGSPERRAGCLSFTVEGAHPFDIATLVDKLGVAFRSGSQCAQPLLNEAYDARGITRISPAFYNTYEEIEIAADALELVLFHIRSSR